MINKSAILIDGMTCNHCAMNVHKAISNVPGVESVEIILSEKKALVDGKFDMNELEQKVESIGYKVIK